MDTREENLIGYALDALDDEERAAVEAYLEANPEGRAQLETLRAFLAPLEEDREQPEPPRGLVLNTLARIAEQTCPRLPQAPPVPASHPVVRVWWRRADVLAASVLVLVSVALGVSWLVSTRQKTQVVECKETLHTFHRSLSAYADQHNGAFPKIHPEGHPLGVAGSFVSVLEFEGAVRTTCPAQNAPGTARRIVTERELRQLHEKNREEYNRVAGNLCPGYAYSLGYLRGEELVGLRRGEVEDRLPILADRPPPGAKLPGNSPNHGGKGQNVLTVGGSVQFVTTWQVGVGADDIYLNLNLKQKAGLKPVDTVLGASDVSP